MLINQSIIQSVSQLRRFWNEIYSQPCVLRGSSIFRQYGPQYRFHSTLLQFKAKTHEISLSVTPVKAGVLLNAAVSNKLSRNRLKCSKFGSKLH